MTEVWQYAIPVVIASAGYFHYLIALRFDKETVLQMGLYAFAFLLMVDSVFAVHQVAINPNAPSQVASRVAYIIMLGSFSFTFLYLVIRGFQEHMNSLAKQGKDYFK